LKDWLNGCFELLNS